MSNLGNKEIMAINIKRLMKKKGVNASTVCADLGFPIASFSDWCNAKSYPRIDRIEKMANYFGVKKAELVEEYNSEYFINQHAIEIANLMRTNPGYRTLFDTVMKVPEKDVDMIARMISAAYPEDDEPC